MWEVNPEIVDKMLEGIAPVKTDLLLKDVLKEDNKIDLPIEGGWGYSLEYPIKFIKQETTYPFVQLEYQIVQLLLYEELIIFRARNDLYSGIEKKLKKQNFFIHDEKYFDRLEFSVTCWHDFYWYKLKAEWEEAKEQNNLKEPFLSDHQRKRQQSMLKFERIFYFDITDVFQHL